MADLLLELFSEEIPARMQVEAARHLSAAVLGKIGTIQLPSIDFSGISGASQIVEAPSKLALKTFVTPRRVALIVNNLPLVQPDVITELKGPKVGAPEAALQGFLKKSGLQQSDLTERDGVFFAVVKKAGSNTADVLKTIIEETLASFPWPKSMRWGGGDATWVRPLHSIICLFDGKVIPVSFAGVTAGNTTRGHRFLSPAVITISKPEEYELLLEKAFVIADRGKRKASILAQAESVAAAAGLQLKKDDGLLEEVAGLVEYPVVLAGKIDAKFMDLPKEVLVSEMRAHQKYFALLKPSPSGRVQGEGPHPNLLPEGEGALSDTFLITANMKTDDAGKAIIAGNERVLRARLSDGRFFWDQDRKKTLDQWAEGLKTVTFHAKLGTTHDQVVRIKTLALQLAPNISSPIRGEGISLLVERAALLCKADLVTGMVGEFPDLQGVMGRYYALAQKEDPAVADAIRDHYKPQGPGDSVPNNPVSVCVALADKLDTLVSMFAIGEKPTGSKDPFALRRSALGIIRIILENNVRLPLKPLFAIAPMRDIALHKAHEKLVKQTEAGLHDAHRVGKYLTVNETACEDIPEDAAAKLTQSLLEFFHDRLIVQLKEQGIRHDVINAVVADGDDDLVRIVARAKAVQEFVGTEDGKNLLAAYKRASNILAIEEKKDNTSYDKDGISLGANAKQQDVDLAKMFSDNFSSIKTAISQEKFTDAMTHLATLRTPIDAFFDAVLINDSDKELRIMRLNLLSRLRAIFNMIANFALIEG